MDISVIVPFYRGNLYMRRLFETLEKNAANAKPLTVELLLVNDSPDCPVAYDADWVRGFTLRILQNPENLGIHASRIRGVRAAEGAYILMLDQDDLLSEHALASQYAAIGTDDIALCNGSEQLPGRPADLFRSVREQKLAARLRYYYTVRNPITSPGQCLIRKDAIPQLWLDRPIRHNGSDDLFLWLLMLNSGCKWAVNPEKLYTHVCTGGNLSADAANIRPSALEVIAVLKENGLLTKKQERQFYRRTEMQTRYRGKSALGKLRIMLAYPDLFLDFCGKQLLSRLP